MNPDDTTEYGEEIASYIEKAFNDDAVCGGAVKLTVVNHDGTSDYTDVYYKHLMVGQYDLGFGSISGNTLNPLNFFEVLKSDNSSGFTLNWGADTSVVSDDLGYDGKFWSFDGLWTAANVGGVFEDGVEVDSISSEATDIEVATDGSVTVKIDFAYNFKDNDDISYSFTNLDIYLVGVGNITLAYKDGDEIVFDEEGGATGTIDEENGKIVITLDSSLVNFCNYYLQKKWGSSSYADYAYVIPGVYNTFWVFEIYVDVSFKQVMPVNLYTTAYYYFD